MIGRTNASSGGGISGNRAVLVARVPSGSTVTATKGAVTLLPKMWVSETYPDQDIALFVFAPAQFDSVNPWTITATNGTDTASTTIIITTNKEYEVVLSYYTYLIKASTVIATFTMFGDVKTMVGNAFKSTGNATGGFYTPITLNGESVIHVDCPVVKSQGGGDMPSIFICSAVPQKSGDYVSNELSKVFLGTSNPTNLTDVSVDLDVSTLAAGPYYVGIFYGANAYMPSTQQEIVVSNWYF